MSITDEKQITLPDFEDFISIASRVGNLVSEKETIEAELELEESKITGICSTDPKYFENGKPASMTYIKARYFFPGLNGELTEKRMKLALVKGQLETAQLTFKIYQAMVDLYRTESANKRGSLT